MAESELLAQAVAEAVNLKASGVTMPSDAPEVRAQVTPGMAPGEATRIATQNLAANSNTPPTQDAAALDLAADLKAFASSPQGQALASVTEKPVETGPERDASTQALMRDLKQFASTRQPDASTPSQEPELQLKR
jgi:hypothetical protein